MNDYGKCHRCGKFMLWAWCRGDYILTCKCGCVIDSRDNLEDLEERPMGNSINSVVPYDRY